MTWVSAVGADQEVWKLLQNRIGFQIYARLKQEVKYQKETALAVSVKAKIPSEEK